MHEFLADFARFFGEGGGEHHDLLLVGGLAEDLLDVAAHVKGVEHLVALVEHKVLDALEVERLGADEAEDAARGADDDVRAVLLQGLLVLVDGHAAEEDGDLEVLHVLGEALVLLGDLEGQLARVAHGDDGRGADGAEVKGQEGLLGALLTHRRFRVAGEWPRQKRRFYPYRTWPGRRRPYR